MRREFHAHAPEGIVNAFVTRGGDTCDPLHPPGLRVKLDLDSSKNQAAAPTQQPHVQ